MNAVRGIGLSAVVCIGIADMAPVLPCGGVVGSRAVLVYDA